MAPSTSRRRQRIYDDDDDEEQPARQTQRRSGRGEDSSRHYDNGDGDDNDDDEQPRRPPKLEAYSPKPLDRGATAVIKQSMTAYTPHEDFIRQAMAFIEESASQVIEAEESMDNETFVRLDADYKALIDAQVECTARRSVLDTLRKRLDEGEKIVDAAAEYKKLAKEKLDAYKVATARQKYGQNKDYIGFRETAWAAAEDSAMPPISEFLPAEEGDEENSDDEIQVGGARQDYKCPYSAALLTDPLTSTECQHSYDRDSILQYVAQGEQGEQTCPATGCSVKLSRRKLKPDPRLAKRVAAFLRREESRTMSNHGRTQILD